MEVRTKKVGSRPTGKSFGKSSYGKSDCNYNKEKTERPQRKPYEKSVKGNRDFKGERTERPRTDKPSYRGSNAGKSFRHQSVSTGRYDGKPRKVDFGFKKPVLHEGEKDYTSTGVLVVINPQNDYVIGMLGSEKAKETEQNIVNYLKENGSKFHSIYFVKDSHYENFRETLEGEHYEPHCISGHEGQRMTNDVATCLGVLKDELKKYTKVITGTTLGNLELGVMLDVITKTDEEITVMGFNTETNVVSTVLNLRSKLPNKVIKVVKDCCCGLDEECHEAALKVMKSCYVEII